MGNNSAPLGTIIEHNEEPGLTQSTQEKGENTANISSTKETVQTYNAFTSFILSKVSHKNSHITLGPPVFKLPVF